MERLQEAIKLTAKIREESWDNDKKEYSISLYDAADQACESIGFDMRGSLPVYLLLKYCWNDILDWANNKSDHEELHNDIHTGHKDHKCNYLNINLKKGRSTK